MAFNTNQPFPAPYAGDPFTVAPGLAPDALDDGAISATWPTLPAATFVSGPSDNCATVDTLTGGRGGLWIADGIATPVLNAAPAPPPPTTRPATTPPREEVQEGAGQEEGQVRQEEEKEEEEEEGQEVALCF